MALVKEIGADIVKRAIDSRRKNSSSDTSDSSGATGSGTAPNDASDSTSSSSTTKKRSMAGDIGRTAARSLLSGGGKRSGGPSSQDYSVAGMGLAGPIADADTDYIDSSGRGSKRSNGKTRG